MLFSVSSYTRTSGWCWSKKMWCYFMIQLVTSYWKNSWSTLIAIFTIMIDFSSLINISFIRIEVRSVAMILKWAMIKC